MNDTRIAELLTGINAKYLVINFGYNDHAQTGGTTNYQNALENIATEAQALGYEVIMVSQFPNYTLDSSAYVTAMQTAATNTGCKFINVWQYLVVSNKTNPNYVYDGVHPNDLGHKVMAEKIALSAPELIEDIPQEPLPDNPETVDPLSANPEL